MPSQKWSGQWVETQSAKDRPAPTLRERLGSKAIWTEIAISSLVAGLVGWFVVYKLWNKFHMAVVVWCISGFISFTALFMPRLHDAIKRGLIWFAHLVGLGLSWLLLVPFYYLCFVPGRIWLSIRGKDPMQRAFPTDEKSYWVPRPAVKTIAQYQKQH